MHIKIKQQCNGRRDEGRHSASEAVIACCIALIPSLCLSVSSMFPMKCMRESADDDDDDVNGGCCDDQR